MATNQSGKINLNELLTKQISSLYMSEHCSDITLFVEEYKIPAHRSIIGARCEYLNNYFSTSSNESNQIKCILNVPLKPFQIILEYLYTGEMDLYRIENIEILIQNLELIEKYCLYELKKYFENYFNEILLVENSCRLLEIAKIYELKELEIKCLNIIDTDPDHILTSESFQKLPQELLQEILTRKSFHPSSELFKYQAVTEWSKHENRNIETVIHLVNLPSIPLKELLKVRNLGTLTGEKIFDTIAKQYYTKTPNFGENIATSELNARTIQGYNIGSQLLTSSNSTLNYDNTGGYIRHIMTEPNDSSVIIELGNSYILNHFKMLLFDCDSRTYSYFIEISTDQKIWNRIINYSTYNCRSWQNLYFAAKTIKYIKLSGTHCSKNKYFDVVKFEAFYLESIPEIKDGFVVPKNNVALVEMGAAVIEGRGFPDKPGIIRQINALGVWHDIGDNRSILIRLSQPFYINSITLQLDGFCKDIKYKFYIETSLDNTNWVEVVNQRNNFVTNWKSFRFPSTLVMFIKIVGTEMSHPDYVPQLHLRKFECSSEQES